MTNGERDDWQRKNAGRLLREQWRTPAALAQEVYAIISDTAPEGLSGKLPEMQVRAETAMPKPAAAPGQGGPAGPGVVKPDFPKLGGGKSAPAQLPGSTGGYATPATSQEFTRRETAPFSSPTGKPLRMANPFPDDEFNLGGLGGDGGSTVLIGKVSDGSGNPIRVTLYPDGSPNAPGATVAVNILQLASGETVPTGTWITGIHVFPTPDGHFFYEAQLPIWLA